ncbi:MAG: class I SAM-dependent rRNA methyltransferase [Pseudomonadota bacterium]
MTARPSIRFRSNKSTQALQFGAPWAYADQLVLDRRARTLSPGSLVTLEDADRVPLATAAFNPKSKIAARVLDRDVDVEIGRTWMDARLGAAFELRDRLYQTPYYRLAHAEADGLPGVVVDRYGEAIVVQPNAAWAETKLDALVASLAALPGVRVVRKCASGRARALEGLDDRSETLVGEIKGPVQVQMNGAIYMADIEGGQKTGLFYDQRDTHAMMQRFARGARVLDVFSHVGGFSLAALAAGAERAVAVDASRPALDLAEEGARAAAVHGRLETVRGDGIDTMAGFAAEGTLFDIVVCDPPAFAPAKAALEAGLRAYERVARKAAPVVAPGGLLVLCSCSHAVDPARFRDVCLKGVGRAGRRCQILHQGGAGPDHPRHPFLAESAYLKSLFLRLI